MWRLATNSTVTATTTQIFNKLHSMGDLAKTLHACKGWWILHLHKDLWKSIKLFWKREIVGQNKERRRVVRDRNNTLGPYAQMHKKPLCVLICASLSTITQKPIFSYFKHKKSRNLTTFNIWKIVLCCISITSESSRYSKLRNETATPGSCWYPPLLYNVLHPGF